jgi:hypothetical protein
MFDFLEINMGNSNFKFFSFEGKKRMRKLPFIYRDLEKRFIRDFLGLCFFKDIFMRM